MANSACPNCKGVAFGAVRVEVSNLTPEAGFILCLECGSVVEAGMTPEKAARIIAGVDSADLSRMVTAIKGRAADGNTEAARLMLEIATTDPDSQTMEQTAEVIQRLRAATQA